MCHCPSYFLQDKWAQLYKSSLSMCFVDACPGALTCIDQNFMTSVGWKMRHSVFQSFIITGWWFGTCFIFPIYWESSSQLTNIFQRGWNHQPGISQQTPSKTTLLHNTPQQRLPTTLAACGTPSWVLLMGSDFARISWTTAGHVHCA